MKRLILIAVAFGTIGWFAASASTASADYCYPSYRSHHYRPYSSHYYRPHSSYYHRPSYRHYQYRHNYRPYHHGYHRGHRHGSHFSFGIHF